MAKMDEKKPQIDKFKQAAHELECDNDDQRFKEQLRRIAKAKPKDSEQP